MIDKETFDKAVATVLESLEKEFINEINPKPVSKLAFNLQNNMVVMQLRDELFGKENKKK